MAERKTKSDATSIYLDPATNKELRRLVDASPIKTSKSRFVRGLIEAELKKTSGLPVFQLINEHPANFSIIGLTEPATEVLQGLSFENWLTRGHQDTSQNPAIKVVLLGNTLYKPIAEQFATWASYLENKGELLAILASPDTFKGLPTIELQEAMEKQGRVKQLLGDFQRNKPSLRVQVFESQTPITFNAASITRSSGEVDLQIHPKIDFQRNFPYRLLGRFSGRTTEIDLAMEPIVRIYETSQPVKI